MIEKLRSEYQTVLNTKFWEVYRAKILSWMSNASTDTDTLDPVSDATKLAREQGKLTAWKQVLGLPDAIVKDK